MPLLPLIPGVMCTHLPLISGVMCAPIACYVVLICFQTFSAYLCDDNLLEYIWVRLNNVWVGDDAASAFDSHPPQQAATLVHSPCVAKRLPDPHVKRALRFEPLVGEPVFDPTLPPAVPGARLVTVRGDVPDRVKHVQALQHHAEDDVKAVEVLRLQGGTRKVKTSQRRGERASGRAM